MCYIHSIKFNKLRKVKSKINICLSKQKNNFFYLTENKIFTKVKKRTKKNILPYLVRCNLTGTRLYITI